jgi:hypothetical protein
VPFEYFESWRTSGTSTPATGEVYTASTALPTVASTRGDTRGCTGPRRRAEINKRREDEVFPQSTQSHYGT